MTGKNVTDKRGNAMCNGNCRQGRDCICNADAQMDAVVRRGNAAFDIYLVVITMVVGVLAYFKGW